MSSEHRPRSEVAVPALPVDPALPASTQTQVQALALAYQLHAELEQLLASAVLQLDQAQGLDAQASEQARANAGTLVL